MARSKILLYALHGAWDTQSHDGVEVLEISEDIKPLQERLEIIAESKANDYIETYGDINENQTERIYEISDSLGQYANFYITEHTVELSEVSMGRISRDMEKIDRLNDIENCIAERYDSGIISAWMYEYMARSREITEQILQKIDNWESSNTPYNTTLESAVADTEKGIVLNDKVVEFLWEEFGDVLIDDEECILDDFLGFECGTHREEVWHWFDRNYSVGGVAALMYGKAEAE